MWGVRSASSDFLPFFNEPEVNFGGSFGDAVTPTVKLEYSEEEQDAMLMDDSALFEEELKGVSPADVLPMSLEDEAALSRESSPRESSPRASSESPSTTKKRRASRVSTSSRRPPGAPRLAALMATPEPPAPAKRAAEEVEDGDVLTSDQRQMKNRDAARLFRQRRKDYLRNLEEEIRQSRQRRSELEVQLRDSQKAATQLKSELLDVKAQLSLAEQRADAAEQRALEQQRSEPVQQPVDMAQVTRALQQFLQANADRQPVSASSSPSLSALSTPASVLPAPVAPSSSSQFVSFGSDEGSKAAADLSQVPPEIVAAVAQVPVALLSALMSKLDASFVAKVLSMNAKAKGQGVAAL